MGSISTHRPVLLLMAVFSRYDEAFQWAREKAVKTYGPLAIESEMFPFEETNYYRTSMGGDLKKAFWTFENLIDPAELPGLKHQTNQWESEYSSQAGHAEPRPLNLDPGYLTEAKLVLASTKDREHRIYLDQGIFAECTLYYQHGKWRAREWTYPDYRREALHAFLGGARAFLRERLRSGTRNVSGPLGRKRRVPLDRKRPPRSGKRNGE